MDKAIDSDLNTPSIEQLEIELRRKGSEALQRGDGSAAELAYRSLLALDATNIYGLVGLGLAAKATARRDEALARLATAAGAWPKHPWPLLEISHILRSGEHLEEAERTLRRALTLDAEHPHVLLALGDLLVHRGELTEAIAKYRIAARHAPRNANAHLVLASTLALVGASEEALTELSAGLETATEKSTLWSAKARLLRTLGRHREAAEAWKAALSEKPDQLPLKSELASDICAAGLYSEALSIYREISGDKRHAEAQRHQACLAAGRLARDILQDTTIAIAFFEHAAALNKGHVQGARELAEQYRAAKRFKDAEVIYHKILDQLPNDVAALAALAALRRISGAAHEALPLIEKACALDPTRDWSLLEFGYILRDLARFKEAITKFEAIDSNSPIRLHALMALAQLAFARNDYPAAANLFDQAAQVAPDPTDALRNLATIRSALGDTKGADAAVAQLLERDPTSYVRLMEVGRIKQAINDASGALAIFERAAELYPNAPQPHIEIAVVALAHGALTSAEAALENALIIDPGHIDALLKRASLLAKKGATDAAIAIYNRLRSERPDLAPPYLAAAELLAKLGDVDAALRLLAAARENCPSNSQIDFKEATVLRQVGRLDESIKRIVLAHDTFPHDFWPWYLRISLCIEIGHFDEAEALFARQPSHVSLQERGHIYKLRAQFLKARWLLEKAIDALDAATDLDPQDAVAHEERAKLELMTFDLPRAWSDLKIYAAIRSVSSRRAINPMHSHTGQLYEESVLDAALSEQLIALRGMPPQKQVARLVQLMRDFPDSTAPAIGLMISLRRAGQLELPPLAKIDWEQTPTIPTLITRFWNDPIPPIDVAQIMASWNNCDSRFQIETFNDSTALSYLRERCAPRIADAYQRAREPAQRADLFRLARLHNEGGFFIDADDRARGGLSAHVPPFATFFAHQEDPGSIGNNVIGATPNHPVIAAALKEATAGVLRGDRDIIWLTTGPGLLTRALANWLSSTPEQFDERLSKVAILTLSQIRGAAAIHCHAGYKNTGRAWLSGAFRKLQ